MSNILKGREGLICHRGNRDFARCRKNSVSDDSQPEENEKCFKAVKITSVHYLWAIVSFWFTGVDITFGVKALLIF